MAPSTSVAGGPEAYVAAYLPPVYGFCYRTLGAAEPARDVAQKVLVHAWPPVHTHDDRAETLRLLAIAYREVLGRASRSQSVARSAPRGSQDVQALLAALPAESRCVVVLRCCCGLNLDEVVTVTGLPLQVIRAHIVDACRRWVPSSHLAHAPAPVLSGAIAGGHLLRNTIPTGQEESNVS